MTPVWQGESAAAAAALPPLLSAIALRGLSAAPWQSLEGGVGELQSVRGAVRISRDPGIAGVPDVGGWGVDGVFRPLCRSCVCIYTCI